MNIYYRKRYRIIISLLVVSFFIPNPTYAKATPDTLSVIHSRKSVRHYIDKSVTKEDLKKIIKAGMAAPTAMDKRPWAFIIITEKKTLLALANNLQYAKMLNNAGAAIVVCGLMDRTIPGNAREFWIQDCSASTQNILLATEALGLGAVWIGIHPVPDNIAAVRKVLSIPENVIPLNIISIGHPVGDEKPKDKYDPSAIHWEQW